ncbi:MAG: DNA adenine methylase [Planctomycetota bacterium]
MRTPQPGSWPGSKYRAMRLIHPYLPPHEKFVSVFGGIGGDILAHDATAHEVLNDLNSDNIRFFRFIQGLHWREFIRQITSFEPTWESWQWARGVLRSDEPCEWKRAVAFGVAANLGGTASDPTSPTASYNHKSKRWKGLATRLAKSAFRLADVELSNLDCLVCIAQHDSPDTLFCVDPPFVLSTQSTTRIYRHQMQDCEHEELLWRLRKIKGKAVIFGYPSSLYDAILGDWDREEIRLSLACSVIVAGTKRRQVTNVVWSNFTLFSKGKLDV